MAQLNLPQSDHRTRSRLLEVTIDIIDQEGLSAVSLDSVSKCANVPIEATSKHFKNTEDLLKAVVARLCDEYAAAWRSVLHPSDPGQRIMSLVCCDFSPTVCNRKTLAVWFTLWGQRKYEAIYKDLIKPIRQERGAAMLENCVAYCSAIGATNGELIAASIDRHTLGIWNEIHVGARNISRQAGMESALAHLKLLLPDLK